MFHIAVQTGLRVSELTGLTCGDVALGDSPSIRCQGKGRKQRAIPLLKPLQSALHKHLNQVPEDPAALIFHNRFGQPLSRWGVIKRLRQTVQRAAQYCPTLNHRSVSPHTFRHTTAMRLLQADVDIMVIALLLGHESPNTTHHYIELDLTMKERCLRKLQPVKKTAARFKPTDRLLQFLQAL